MNWRWGALNWTHLHIFNYPQPKQFTAGANIERASRMRWCTGCKTTWFKKRDMHGCQLWVKRAR